MARRTLGACIGALGRAIAAVDPPGGASTMPTAGATYSDGAQHPAIYQTTTAQQLASGSRSNPPNSTTTSTASS